MNTKLKRWGLRGSAIGIAALATTLGLGAAVSSATPARTVAHSADTTVAAYSNSLARNTSGWCTFASGCNGVQSNSTYGTIDVVPSTFSNYGGYAPSAKGPINQTASYARFRVRVTPSPVATFRVFPHPAARTAAGPTPRSATTRTPRPSRPTGSPRRSRSLGSTWAAANPGQVVEQLGHCLNTSSATYLQDFIFNLCTTSAGGGGFYVSTSNNAGGCTTGQRPDHPLRLVHVQDQLPPGRRGCDGHVLDRQLARPQCLHRGRRTHDACDVVGRRARLRMASR